MYIYYLLIFIIFICLVISFIPFFFENIENIENIENPENIPIVIICWNNYYFVKNFINQLKKYKNPIIILDNNSNLQDLLEYYKEIKKELQNRIEIRLLTENYGHTVYLKLKEQLPYIYILSDPDLEINDNLPQNFAEILLNISNEYKSYKVGSALDISDKEKFIQCDNYTGGLSIYEWEKQFWQNRINNNDYELYYADIDTTFCLINNNYTSNNIRVAGVFTAKHLPWYLDYIKNNVHENEIENWKKNNKSSSILHCVK
jgi:hypothetical protein